MNKTEFRALNWLVKKGYNVRPSDNPDFISDDGTGYEVKLLRSNTITFSHGQIQKLGKYQHETHILVFSIDGDEPYKIFPAKLLFDGTKDIDGIKIVIPSKLIGMYVTNEEHLLIKLAAIGSGKTMSDWLKEVLLDWVKKEAQTGKLGDLISQNIEKLNKEE